VTAVSVDVRMPPSRSGALAEHRPRAVFGQRLAVGLADVEDVDREKGNYPANWPVTVGFWDSGV